MGGGRKPLGEEVHFSRGSRRLHLVTSAFSAVCLATGRTVGLLVIPWGFHPYQRRLCGQDSSTEKREGERGWVTPWSRAWPVTPLACVLMS